VGTDSVFERLKAFPKDGTKKGFWDTEKGQEGKVVSDGLTGLHLTHRSWEVGPASGGCGFRVNNQREVAGRDS